MNTSLNQKKNIVNIITITIIRDLSTNYNKFYCDILMIVDKYMQKKIVDFRSNNNTWFDELKKEIKLKDQAFKKYSILGKEDWVVYKSFKNKINNLIKTKKVKF